MADEIYVVEIEGTAPLIFSKFAEKMESTSRSKEYVPEIEADLACHKFDNVPAIPFSMFKAAMVKAGKAIMIKRKSLGNYVKGGIIPKTQASILPKYEILRCGCNQRGMMVIKSRPIWYKWSAKFEFMNIDPGNLTEPKIKQIIEDAGKYCGIGSWRPENGRFVVKSFAKIG